MISPSIIMTLLVMCSAKNIKWNHATRESFEEWRTIECTVLNGEQTEECPSPGPNGVWPCIRYSDLCNGHRDCPNGEDESPLQCHFHQLHRAELDAIRQRLHKMSVELNRRTSIAM